MTRKEAIDIFVNDIMFDENHDESDKEYITRIANCMYEPIVKKAENDILNEFVEWLKEQYKDTYQLYNEEMKEETNSKNYMWFVGRKDGIGEIRQLLKTAVEKFLEENEDGTKKDEI